MVSKKDKFGKKVRSTLSKKLGDSKKADNQPQTMPDLIQELDEKKDETKKISHQKNIKKTSSNTNEIDLPSERAEEKIQHESEIVKNTSHSKQTGFNREDSMPRNRDSIYNVSTDIRLEDYTEDDQDSEKSYGGIIRFIGGVLLISLLGWGVHNFQGLLFGPTYQMAITNEEVDESAVSVLDDRTEVVLSSSRPVFIRFQWDTQGMASDYVRIRIVSASTEMEVAQMGRMVPISVNYILFAGPLESGRYKIIVEDRGGSELLVRDFLLR